MFTKKATPIEVKNARYVDSLIDMDEILHACELVSDHLLTSGKAHKVAYDKLYRYGKQIGATVTELVDWYTTDC